MKRISRIVGTMAAVALLSGCATYNGDYDGGNSYDAPRYSSNAYDNSCDYYSPPWGYPADYCRYQTWNDPVYFQGSWYSGPIYYRNYAGTNWFWLNGDWRHDEWRGPRPAIDWNRNRYWRGEIVHARDGRRDFDGRRDLGGRNFDNDRRGANERNFDNDRRGRDERDFRNGGGNAPAPRNGQNDGRFGGRGPGDMERANYGPPPGPGGGPGPRDNAVQGGRFDGRGPGNAERGNGTPPPDGGRGPRNNTANNPAPGNGPSAAPPVARAERTGDTAAKPSAPPQGRGLVGGLIRGRAAATDKNNASSDADDKR